jgi:ubiquinone/menaquinone biosynthesis C-methylase UbiE
MKSPLAVRFNSKDHQERNRVWKILIEEVFQSYINRGSSVLDVGAGFCEFINNVSCKDKFAIDLSDMIKKYAGKKVKTIRKPFLKISKVYYGKFDTIFMSNFLEHLSDKDEVIKTLTVSHKLLKPHGKLLIMQPNIDLIKTKYWDRIDHNIALNGESLKEGLELSGFKIQEYYKKFLPYTFQQKLPTAGVLIRIYLKLPQILRIFAGQSLFVALKK